MKIMKIMKIMKEFIFFRKNKLGFRRQNDFYKFL
jgi:hypothetical protein